MEQHDFVIRAATLEDAGPLAAMLARVFAATYGAAIPAATLAAYQARVFSPEQVAADLCSSAYSVFVAASNQAIIGASMLARAAPEQHALLHPVELARLYVDADWHGRGVAAALLDHSCATARQSGHATIWLCVWQRNQRALAFYRKRGFNMIGDMPVYVDTIRFDDLVMQRTLDDY